MSPKVICDGAKRPSGGRVWERQGRTQDVFHEGQDYLQYSRDNANEGAQRPSGGRVWEGGGGVPLPHEGAFAFLRLKLNDLVHTLGGFFLIIIKVRRKYIFMENLCFLHYIYRITGYVKSKHKQYDHWHSQDFSTGGQSEGAKRPSGERVRDHGREIFLKICVSIFFFFFAH